MLSKHRKSVMLSIQTVHLSMVCGIQEPQRATAEGFSPLGKSQNTGYLHLCCRKISSCQISKGKIILFHDL